MRRFTLAAQVGVLLAATVAGAQPSEPPPPPPPPPPVDAPVVEAPPAAEPSHAAMPGRIRFGASAGFGTFVPGPMINFAAEARVGYQFTDMLGLYGTLGYNRGLWIGGSIQANSNGAKVTENIGFVGYVQLGAEGELLLGNHFFIAAGPKIAKGGWGFVGQSASAGSGGGGAEQYAGIVDGWLPGVGTKLGVGFGRPDPTTGRRSGFTMMLDTTFLYGSGGVRFAQSAGSNGSGATASQIVAPLSGWGIAPMLMFGFESR